jgi:hypothetical protein
MVELKMHATRSTRFAFRYEQPDETHCIHPKESNRVDWLSTPRCAADARPTQTPEIIRLQS